MLLAEEYSSIRDEKLEMLSRSYSIHYIDFVVSFIYLSSKIVDLCFAAHKLETFLQNPRKVNFQGLVHLLIYISYNKNLGLIYYAKIQDAPLSYLFVKAVINNENQLMVFSDSVWQDYLDTIISTEAYILFIKVDQLIIAQIFQLQFLNQFLKVSATQNSLQ